MHTLICDCAEPGPSGFAAPTCKAKALDVIAKDKQGEQARSDGIDYVRYQSSCSKHLTKNACAGDDNKFRGNPNQAPNTCKWYPN